MVSAPTCSRLDRLVNTDTFYSRKCFFTVGSRSVLEILYSDTRIIGINCSRIMPFFSYSRTSADLSAVTMTYHAGAEFCYQGVLAKLLSGINFKIGCFKNMLAGCSNFLMLSLQAPSNLFIRSNTLFWPRVTR